MSNIVIRTDAFRVAMYEMTTASGVISQGKVKTPKITANSEPLKNYIECFEEIQAVMNAYSALLEKDSATISHFVHSMVDKEEHLIGPLEE